MPPRTSLLRNLIASFLAAASLASISGNVSLSSANAAPIEPLHPAASDWQTIAHDTLGFKISYPGSVFQPAPEQPSSVGQVLVSRDGTAKLLIAAFDNEADSSLAEYRAHVLETSYPRAEIDYAPVRKSWFVLSGNREGTTFYERVSFTCQGRRITSWAMLYPYAQRHYYDRILEQIARTFQPSRTAPSGC